MRKPAVHFNTNPQPLHTDPACHVAQSHHKFTRNPRKVTCGLCQNSPEWRSSNEVVMHVVHQLREITNRIEWGDYVPAKLEQHAPVESEQRACESSPRMKHVGELTVTLVVHFEPK
jgi:hypothetical protein